jgi:Winged helix-turn helix
MAQVTAHLSPDALEARFVASRDARESRHVQAIWLLAKGHTVAEVSEMTAFGVRWIEQLLTRYNAEGPEALGDLRRGNGARATVLTPELLDRHCHVNRG